MTKKQALRAVLFIIGFLFLLRSVTYIVRTSGDTKDRFSGFYAEKENSIDVILAGSSPVYPYYSAPMIYGEQGIVCYPLSSNNQRPRAIRYLLEEALKTQKPQLFAIELRMFSMPDEEWEDTMAFTRGVTDNLKYSLNRIRAINALVSDKSQRHTYYFDIFKYHSNWKMLFLPSQLAHWRYERADDLKGLEIKTGVGPIVYEDMSRVTGQRQMQDKQYTVLLDLLEYLKETGIETLFFLSPYQMEQEDKEIYNFMIPIIEEAGFPVLDLNDCMEETGIDFGVDFYDYGSHVNALGQRKCTAFLGAYLQEHYDLPDRRGQEGYESWDEAYRLYQKLQVQAEESCLADLESKNWAPEVLE